MTNTPANSKISVCVWFFFVLGHLFLICVSFFFCDLQSGCGGEGLWGGLAAACLPGSVFGLPGFSRCFHSVPHGLLIILAWPTAKHKPPGQMSDRCGTQSCSVDVF